MGRLIALTAIFDICRAELMGYQGGHYLAFDPSDGKSELVAVTRVSQNRA
jgi:hypothetical protein